MSFNNKEYLQWKKNKKNKRTLLGICIGILGIGAGTGIGFAISNSVKSTPAKIYNEFGIDWEGYQGKGTVEIGNYNDDTHTCSIIDNTSYHAKDLVIPEFIKHEGKTYRITEISGYYEGVTWNGAFAGTLESPNINLSGIITISNSVISIGDKAFERCVEIDELIMGENVTSIGQFAFRYCTELISSIVDANNKISNDSNNVYYIRNSLNYYCLGQSSNVKDGGTSPIIEIKSNTKVIADYAFNNCYGSSKDLIIPDSVISIGKNAFNGCMGFSDKKLVIGRNVETIDKMAFVRCDFSNKLEIPDSVISIGTGAFLQCPRLNELYIGKNVKSIGSDAFYWCTSLSGTLKIPDSVEMIGGSAFELCAINGVSIGANVIKMDTTVFRMCSNLSSIELRNFSKDTSTRSWTGAFEGIYNSERGEVSAINNIGFKGMTSEEAWDFLKDYCDLDVDGDEYYAGWDFAPEPIIQ